MSGSYSVERTPKAPKKPKADRGELKGDEYKSLWTDLTRQPASVSMAVGRSMEFGAVKVQAHVTLHCDQNEKTINKAGELAFNKACELLNDGWSLLVDEEGS